MATRTELGQFEKRLKVWDGSDWGDGWHDNKGRFRVYRPDYPRAFPGGYALRYHVVWWLKHGECHPEGMVLHHRNEIKDDDRLENLQLMPHGDHTALHHQKPGVQLVCEGCGETYCLPAWRIRQKKNEGSQPRFCSIACRSKVPWSEEHKRNHSEGLRRAYAEGRGPCQVRRKRGWRRSKPVPV